MKKKIVFLCFLAVSVLLNLIPLFVFKNNITFPEHSYFPIIAMTLLSLNGILSYILRHKNNYLSFGTPRGRALGADQTHTFSKEYRREFYWQFIVYWVAIPFHIPCIFFSNKPIHSIWTLCVIFAPQLVFVIYGLINTFKDVKESRSKQLEQEKELKEQQRREESGHFK